MSILIGPKLMENAKIEKFKLDILLDFQTMWDIKILKKNLKNGKDRTCMYVYQVLYKIMTETINTIATDTKRREP